MTKVTFNLQTGYNIGNYRIDRPLGSGFTAEAYLVKEIPTSAQRVLKLYERFDDNQQIQNMRDFEHYCWFLEEMSSIGLLPRYYHMGHTFLRNEDGIGHYFMIQEYLNGTKFIKKQCSAAMIQEFRIRVSQVHSLGYGLGDFTSDNMLIVGQQIRMVDCDYGSHNKPNTKMRADIKSLNALFRAGSRKT